MNRQPTLKKKKTMHGSSAIQNTNSSDVNTKGGGHNRVDSQTGLLKNQQDNWLDYQMQGTKPLNSQDIDLDSSQLILKLGQDMNTFSKQVSLNKGSKNNTLTKKAQTGFMIGLTDQEFEKQMEIIISEYDAPQNPQQITQNGNLQTIKPNQLMSKQPSFKISNCSTLPLHQPQNMISGLDYLNISNPVIENIEKCIALSIAQSKSNIATMIQQFGQDPNQIEDVDYILQEEDNIKEASQYRSREIISRQRSGRDKPKFRSMTTIIKDPDVDQMENETDAQILKIKRFCKKICSCCKKPENIEDSFIYTSGDSDIDCQEMYLNMEEDEQQYRVLDLWQETIAKAKGAVKVIEIFGDLNRRIYLYGSDKKHDYLYEQDKLRPLPIVIFPFSKTKNIWNVVMMLLVIYTGTYIPYKTAFIDSSSSLVNYIELGIDSLFVFDIIVNFLSAYEDSERNVEFRLTKIAYQYIMGWFVFDLISCIPFQYLDFSPTNEDSSVITQNTDQVVQSQVEGSRLLMEQAMRFLQTNSTTATAQANQAKYSKLLKLTRLPRLYKLLRILRLFKMMRLLKYNRNIKKLFDQLKLNPGYMKMITVTVTVLFLVHVVSCFYFLIAAFTDFDPDSWVVKKKLQDDTNFAQYITAMYWAFQTLTTVGYGDVQGNTTLERVYCLLWMIFGVAFYSFTIGNLQSIISTIDVKASELTSKLNTLTGFAKRTKLPDNIVLKIKRFLENNSVNNSSLSESRQMLSELPSTLRAEVVKQTYADIIEKIKFFNEKDSDFLWAFLPALKPMKVYSKDILYSQGDHPEEVFFIQKGKVKLCYDISEGVNSLPINIPFNKYVEGSYFGDLEILIKRYRKLGRDGTAIVDSECHLLVINSKELKSILKYFGDVEIQMIHTAKKRRKHHQKQIEEAKSRYVDKKVKALKNASLFQGKNALNQFSNWKKKLKKEDNSMMRAKDTIRKLEIIASHKSGIAIANQSIVKTLAKKVDSVSDYDESEVEEEEDADSEDEDVDKTKNQDLSQLNDDRSSIMLTDNRNLGDIGKFTNTQNGISMDENDGFQRLTSADQNTNFMTKFQNTDALNSVHYASTFTTQALTTQIRGKGPSVTNIFNQIGLTKKQEDLSQRDMIQPKTEISPRDQQPLAVFNINFLTNNAPKKLKEKKHEKKNGNKLKNISSKPDYIGGFKHLKQERLDKQITSQYDHEKQIRLFNDTMSALALNAYEINGASDKIGKQLEFRNVKLDKMDSQTKNIESSLNNMERLLNKIMDAI